VGTPDISYSPHIAEAIQKIQGKQS